MPASGCFIGFDDHKLRNGSDGGASSSGGGAADDPAGGSPGTPPGSGSGNPGPSSGIPSCDDFSGYADGASIPHWVEGRGTWRIVAGPPRGLGQMSPTDQSHLLYLGWYDATAWTDQIVTAVLAPVDEWADNCALARVSDSDNFYALCVSAQHNGHMGGGSSWGWNLKKLVAGSETSLVRGSLSAGVQHTVSLGVHGVTLSATVDGQKQPDVTDSDLSRGAAGLGTESSGVFVHMCAGQM
jgi:hypothetical protein